MNLSLFQIGQKIPMNALRDIKYLGDMRWSGETPNQRIFFTIEGEGRNKKDYCRNFTCPSYAPADLVTILGKETIPDEAGYWLAAEWDDYENNGIPNVEKVYRSRYEAEENSSDWLWPYKLPIEKVEEVNENQG